MVNPSSRSRGGGGTGGDSDRTSMDEDTLLDFYNENQFLDPDLEDNAVYDDDGEAIEPEIEPKETEISVSKVKIHSFLAFKMPFFKAFPFPKLDSFSISLSYRF